jgi:hypothetical protein
MYCVIKCVKNKLVLKGNFASSVFNIYDAKTQMTRILVTCPQCVKLSMGVGGQRHVTSATPPAKWSGMHCTVGQVGPKGQSGWMRKVLPSLRFNTRIGPACSELVYCRCYPSPHCYTVYCHGLIVVSSKQHCSIPDVLQIPRGSDPMV